MNLNNLSKDVNYPHGAVVKNQNPLSSVLIDC